MQCTSDRGYNGLFHDKRARSGSKLTKSSRAFAAAMGRVGVAAPTDSSILLRRETRRGMERSAQQIHEPSLRLNALVVLINCAAILSGPSLKGDFEND